MFCVKTEILRVLLTVNEAKVFCYRFQGELESTAYNYLQCILLRQAAIFN